MYYAYNNNMEKCQRKVNSYTVTRSVYLMGLFDWKLVKEEKKENAPSTLYFERDESVPYYEEMVEIEKTMSPKLLPFWVLIIPVAVAFILVTIFLILYLANKSNFNTMTYFFAFFIPAMALLLVDTLVFYLRSRQLMNHLKKEDELVKNAEEKMKALREKYKDLN